MQIREHIGHLLTACQLSTNEIQALIACQLSTLLPTFTVIQLHILTLITIAHLQ